MCTADVEAWNDVSYPPTPGVVRMDIKRKDLQIGMLEVVENKGATWRLKSVGMRLIERKERFGRGLVRTNTI